MFTSASKIKKEKGTAPSDLENEVASALFDLEVNVSELKADLRELYISAATEVDIAGGKKAVIIFVPYPLLKQFQAIHSRLVRELEKKFSGKHVVIIGQRRIIAKPNRRVAARVGSDRPRSRTLTKVHESILEDLVYPAEIVNKRVRYRIDGKFYKVELDSKEQVNTEYKLDSFTTIYRKLTGKDVTFSFADTQF